MGKRSAGAQAACRSTIFFCKSRSARGGLRRRIHGSEDFTWRHVLVSPAHPGRFGTHTRDEVIGTVTFAVPFSNGEVV